VNTRLRSTAALLGVSGLIAVTGCGTDGSSDVAAASGQPAGTQSQTGAPPGQAGQGPDLGALAEKLGVSEAKLKHAMEAARPQPGQAPDGDPFSALAEKLGVSETKVRSAMEPLMPQGAPPAGRPPQDGGSGTTARTTAS
jgi:biotin operon repressor